METSYNITAGLVTTQAYLDMLAEALGYKETIQQWNSETNTMETIDNPESKVEFLTNQIKNILVNETTRPIQSMIYNQATQEANNQYQQIRSAADENILVDIEEL